LKTHPHPDPLPSRERDSDKNHFLKLIYYSPRGESGAPTKWVVVRGLIYCMEFQSSPSPNFLSPRGEDGGEGLSSCMEFQSSPSPNFLSPRGEDGGEGLSSFSLFFQSLYSMESMRAWRLASMIFSESPTVPQVSFLSEL